MLKKELINFLYPKLMKSRPFYRHEQNAWGREQNAAGGRRIYERPDQPTNEKHET